MNTKILEDIGLNGSEIKVFLTLVEQGPSYSNNIVEHSKLQNAVVHRSLNSLINKGLVSFVYVGKKKQYQNAPLKTLVEFIDNKKSEVKELVEKLEKKKSLFAEKELPAIYKGRKGIKEIWHLTLEKENSTVLNYGGSQTAHEYMGDVFWKIYHERRTARNIKVRFLFHESLRWQGDKIKGMPLSEVKYTPQEFESITETVIFNDYVCIMVYCEEPYAFLIPEGKVAESYKRFFEYLWNDGKN